MLPDEVDKLEEMGISWSQLMTFAASYTMKLAEYGEVPKEFCKRGSDEDAIQHGKDLAEIKLLENDRYALLKESQEAIEATEKRIATESFGQELFRTLVGKSRSLKFGSSDSQKIVKKYLQAHNNENASHDEICEFMKRPDGTEKRTPEEIKTFLETMLNCQIETTHSEISTGE